MDKQKKTPVMRFPEFTDEWSNLKYSSIFSFRSTNSFSRENLNYTDGLVKNIHYGDIHTKFNTLFDITKEEVPFINNDIELKNIPEDNYCTVGDLILADASEDYADVGKCIEIVGLNNEKVVSGLHTILARPDLHKMTVGFNGYLMKSEKIRLQIKTIAQGSKVLSISTKRFVVINLSIPQITEQQKIASFLTAVDTKLTQLKQKKSLLEQYKKGVMQKIFSQEIRFKDEYGKEYPKWEKKKLGEVTNYVDYRGRAPIKTEEGYFLVTAKNIKKGFIDYECSKEYVSVNDYSNVMSKGLPEVGDVLFTTEAPMGNVAQVDKRNIALAQRVIKFRSKKMLSNLFLLHYMLSDNFQRLISTKAIGTTVQGISGKELHQLKITLPTFAEQTKIAKFLSAIDEKINHCQLQIEITVLYKKGLLQKMFC